MQGGGCSATKMSDIEDEPPSVLLPCTVCSRTFRPEVLERHTKVCEKSVSKKRRVFDSFKSRVSGTELEEFLGPAPLPGQTPKRSVKSPVKKRGPSKWKETHENLIAVLRAARGVAPPSDTVVEAPKPAGNEQCPSCYRFFGPRAFDRHVEFCKEKTARIKMTPSKVSQAQERLEARTKYRAPLSIKPKLTTKEKYSPMLPRKESTESCPSSTKTSPPIPTLNRNAKIVKMPSGFSRQSPIRNSERHRSTSPNKKNIISSSKSNCNKNEAKAPNQPKIKENLKSPDDLKPKASSKNTTQEKIRICSPKPTQLQDETLKPTPRSVIPADEESIETVESENRNNVRKQMKSQNKCCSSGNTGKKVFTAIKKEKSVESVRNFLSVSSRESDLEKPIAKQNEDGKSGKKNAKFQNPQINDLSVNDESFGIFVAPCTVQPVATSRKFKQTVQEEKTDSVEETDKFGIPYDLFEKSEKKNQRNSEKKIPLPVKNIKKCDHTINSNQECKKFQRFTSKIPKAKSDTIPKSILIGHEKFEADNECFQECQKIRKEEKKTSPQKIEKIEMKWQNIAKSFPENTVRLCEDFELPDKNTAIELSESDIWEIAGEQFLRSEDSVQNTSVNSVDSLNENLTKTQVEEDYPAKTCPSGDDFIVLHVADPSKMVENDADMKLSISEPCFPYSGKTSKIKDISSDKNKIDIVVFTACPSAIQYKLIHRKRRKLQKQNLKVAPILSPIREKTFLASDYPKAKRRKLGESEKILSHETDFNDNFFVAPSKKEFNERKKKFIEGLKHQKEKIRKWQITASTHVRFMEEFEKSIEDDLKELKNLSKGKKLIRKPSLKEYKKEKIKEMRSGCQKFEKLSEDNAKVNSTTQNRGFEYFEIFLEDDNLKPEKIKEDLRESAVAQEFNKEMNKKLRNHKKKIEIFEISCRNGLDSCKPYSFYSCASQNKDTINPEVIIKKDKKKPSVDIYNKIQSPQTSFDADGVQILNHQNSSLENIEEVDEDEEKSLQQTNKIEIEDFIISKPDTEKILFKGEDCLDGLFPKPKKAAETLTSTESKTAIQLNYTTNSIFDLKSKEEEKCQMLPQISVRSNSRRILQKRVRKGSCLPHIAVKSSSERKENSMISLMELWKNKNLKEENEKVFKTKAILPNGKLTPLSNKNSFQIGTHKDGSYDPFKQAERQMLALLSWPSTADIKSIKNVSPKPKPTQKSNLETSPTSAFTKYPNKDDNLTKNDKASTKAKKNFNETFEIQEMTKKNIKNEKPTYTAADDWEEIFEKHFDLNRNETTEQVTKSVKSVLDGLLKNPLKNNSKIENSSSPPKNQNDLSESSIITEILYTSTPKQNSKSNKNSKSPSKETTIDLNQTPNTYRKNSNYSYGRITPSEDLNDPHDKRKKDEKANRNSGISLSSLSFCSQISDTTLADEEVMRSNLEIIGKAAAAAAAKTPRRKYARSQSVFDERNKMLFAQTYNPNISSSDDNDIEVWPKIAGKQRENSPSRNPYPKSVPSHSFRSQSVIEGKCRGDGDHSDDGDHVSSPDNYKNRKAKLSGDSAYSSLNRRSPRQKGRQSHQEDQLSSSGSEHSLLNVGSNYQSKTKSLGSNESTTKKDQPVKMSKFCHECGSKYPVLVAKFCCECGVRRLII